MALAENTYVRIWEFQAHSGREHEFEILYGPQGGWVHLFQKSKAFLRSELYRDTEISGRYVTVDYFVSQSDFEAFLREFRQAYDALDRLGEALCASEKPIGSFANVQRS